MAASDRSVFLYLDPEDAGADFQCGSCVMWLSKRDRCLIHGRQVVVKASASCCYYLYGAPDLVEDEGCLGIVTPADSGLVDRAVRCENCKWFDAEAGRCGFYRGLNRRWPEIFNLNTKVDAKGCCNAQEPRTEREARQERIRETTF